MSDSNRILSDIRAYLRVFAAATLKGSAAKILDSYEKAHVYSMLDGKTSQLKIESSTGVPQQTISKWLAVFVEASLASPPDIYNENYKALFTLRELGMELTTLKKREKKGAPSKADTQPPTPKEMPDSSLKDSLEKFIGEEKTGTSKQ